MTYEELQEIERSVSGRRGMNGALIDMGMSKGQAARICGAYRWLKEHGAEEFERAYAERGNAEAMEVLGISKDTMYGIVAILGGKYKKRGDVDREWLYREYIEKNRSMGEIAEEIGADRDFIGRQTRKYGIKKDKAARYRGSIEKGKRTSEEHGIYKRAREKRERTMLMRYGVDNAMASREIREKTYGESIGITGDVERLRSVIEGLSDAERTALGIAPLPRNLEEALAAMEEDELVRGTLGENISRSYIKAKRREWEEYCAHVSEWETEQYLYRF